MADDPMRSALAWERCSAMRCRARRHAASRICSSIPKSLAEGMIATFTHLAVGRYRGVTQPIKFGRAPGSEAFAAPAFNQDGAQILTSIGAFVPREED